MNGLRTGTAAVLAMAVLLVSGCGATPAPQGRTGGTLYVLTQDTSIDLDPARNLNLPTTWLGLVGRRLTNWDVRPGQAPKLVPDLATDLGKPSADGLTWTFTLKDGITYEDGTPVTSRDIKYGVERSFAPQLAGGLAYHKVILKDAGGYTGPYDGADLAAVSTPDDKTIVFHLAYPYGDWPWIVSTPAFVPVPKDKDDPKTYGTKPSATGPYKVDSNTTGVSLTLVRNERWSAATDPVRTAGPDRIVFKLGQNLSTTTQTLLADVGDAKNSFNANPLGAADLALVNNNAAAKSRLVTSDAGSLFYLALNAQRGALSDVRVRQALEYAVDRRAVIIAQGGPGAAVKASTLITPGIPGRQDYDLYPAGDSGDPDKAKSLLAQAGHDRDLKLTLWVANDEQSQAIGQAVQQGLQRAGVAVTMVPLDPATMYTDATGDAPPGYDLMLSWWLPDFPSAWGNVYPLFHSSQIGGGGYNLSRFKDPEVDTLLNAAVAEPDLTKAQQLWAQADRAVMQSAPVIPLTFGRNAFLRGSNVQNMFVAAYPPFQNYLTVSLKQ
ncbi:ABC transporter substrate-binding protein [Dactylosporangium sp. CA-092794]|uniref:ABC transporter substrate-binding protein n=1 Tax=Dactylosporangium sp. CA-092794 TaxID=3239929 RepID=UPI003D90A505